MSSLFFLDENVHDKQQNWKQNLIEEFWLFRFAEELPAVTFCCHFEKRSKKK